VTSRVLRLGQGPSTQKQPEQETSMEARRKKTATTRGRQPSGEGDESKTRREPEA
jgi:hypothetical protein